MKPWHWWRGNYSNITDSKIGDDWLQEDVSLQCNRPCWLHRSNMIPWCVLMNEVTWSGGIVIDHVNHNPGSDRCPHYSCLQGYSYLVSLIYVNCLSTHGCWQLKLHPHVLWHMVGCPGNLQGSTAKLWIHSNWCVKMWLLTFNQSETMILTSSHERIWRKSGRIPTKATYLDTFCKSNYTWKLWVVSFEAYLLSLVQNMMPDMTFAVFH